eukprot:Clim_evm8s168 gene=Clim_evmTU8s168
MNIRLGRSTFGTFKRDKKEGKKELGNEPSYASTRSTDLESTQTNTILPSDATTSTVRPQERNKPAPLKLPPRRRNSRHQPGLSEQVHTGSSGTPVRSGSQSPRNSGSPATVATASGILHTDLSVNISAHAGQALGYADILHPPPEIMTLQTFLGKYGTAIVTATQNGGPLDPGLVIDSKPLRTSDSSTEVPVVAVEETTILGTDGATPAKDRPGGSDRSDANSDGKLSGVWSNSGSQHNLLKMNSRGWQKPTIEKKSLTEMIDMTPVSSGTSVQKQDGGSGRSSNRSSVQLSGLTDLPMDSIGQYMPYATPPARLVRARWSVTNKPKRQQRQVQIPGNQTRPRLLRNADTEDELDAGASDFDDDDEVALHEAHFIQFNSLPARNGLVKVEGLDPTNNLIFTGASSGKMYLSGNRRNGLWKARDTPFAYIPADAEILLVDGFRESDLSLILVIAWRKQAQQVKVGGVVNYVNIYGAKLSSPFHRTSLDDITADCQCIPLGESSPLHINHIHIVGSGETYLFVASADGEVKLLRKSKRRNSYFTPVKPTLVLPELAEVRSPITYIDVMQAQNIRLTAVGCQDGAVHVFRTMKEPTSRNPSHPSSLLASPSGTPGMTRKSRSKRKKKNRNKNRSGQNAAVPAAEEDAVAAAPANYEHQHIKLDAAITSLKLFYGYTNRTGNSDGSSETLSPKGKWLSVHKGGAREGADHEDNESERNIPQDLHLAVGCAVGLCVLFPDCGNFGLSRGYILPKSESYDSVVHIEIADVDWDGENEIIISTFGKHVLIYKIMDESSITGMPSPGRKRYADDLTVGIIWLRKFNDPVMATAYIDMSGDGVKELVILGTAGLHFFQHDLKRVKKRIMRTLKAVRDFNEVQRQLNALLAEG